MENKNKKKQIIPAAGLGTRFLPATKAQPKEMLPIVDKPTLQLHNRRMCGIRYRRNTYNNRKK